MEEWRGPLSGRSADGHIPTLATMFEDVYKDMPAHLQEQFRQAAAFAAES